MADLTDAQIDAALNRGARSRALEPRGRRRAMIA